MYTILVLPHPQQWVGYCPVSAAGLRGEHLVRVGQCCRWCLEAGPTHGMGRSISLLSNCSWFENEQACLQPFTEKGILQVCFFFSSVFQIQLLKAGGDSFPLMGGSGTVLGRVSGQGSLPC